MLKSNPASYARRQLFWAKGAGCWEGGGGQLVCPFRQSSALSFYLVSIFIFLFCLKELSAEGAKSDQCYDNVFTLKMHHASRRTIGRRESSKAHRQWCVRRIIRLVPIFIKGGGESIFVTAWSAIFALVTHWKTVLWIVIDVFSVRREVLKSSTVNLE